MATYPTFRQSTSSTEARVPSRITDRATNGVARTRSLVPVSKKIFTVVHEFLTTEQKLELELFYTTNSNSEFYFTWVPDGFEYYCIYGDSEPVFTVLRAGYWNVSTTLFEV